jgi:hypothetical protein
MQILKFVYEFKQDRLIVVFRQMSNAKYNLEETHNKMVCFSYTKTGTCIFFELLSCTTHINFFDQIDRNDSTFDVP